MINASILNPTTPIIPLPLFLDKRLDLSSYPTLPILEELMVPSKQIEGVEEKKN